MSKLREDQISWVLNLDAKGVQGEVQKLSNSIRGLKDENKFLKNEMRDANKQMSDAEKEMKKLEKAGRMHSKAYKEARGTYEGAKDEIAAYKTQLEKNNKTIDQHNKKLDTTIKTMRIEDMTMAQLKKRAGELQGQLNHTSMAADPKKYKELQTELTKVQGRMGEVKGANQTMVQGLTSIPGPVGGAVRSLQGLGRALKALLLNPVGILIMAIVVALVALQKAWGSFTSRYDEWGDKMQARNAGLKASFDFLVDKAVEKLGDLKEWFNDFDEKLLVVWERAKNFFKGIIDEISDPKESFNKLEERAEQATEGIKNTGKRVFGFLKKAVTDPQGAFETIVNKVGSAKNKIEEWGEPLVNAAKEVEKVYTEAEKLEMQLIANADRQREFSVESARANLQIKQLEEIYRDVRKSDEERLAATQKARKVEIERAEEEERLLQEKFNIIVAQNSLAVSGRKDIEKQQQAEKELIAAQQRSYETRIRVNRQLAALEQEADKKAIEAVREKFEEQQKILETTRQFAIDRINDTEVDAEIVAVKIAAAEAEFAQRRLEIQKAFGLALAEVELENGDLRKEAIEDNQKVIEQADSDANQARLDAEREFNRQSKLLNEAFIIETLDERMQTEADALKRLYDEKLLSEEAYQIALKGLEDKYNSERAAARGQWGLISIQESFNHEMEVLSQQYAAKLLSEEEFERAKLNLKLQYAQQYVQQEQQLAQAGANALNAIQDAQIARAGDDEAKKLEIQKKFADAQFALQVAQIIGSTAQGIMSAWASAMVLPVPFSQITGAAMAALIGATGVAQVKAANAERQRIKSLTLGGGGGGGASTPTASPIATAQMVLNSSSGFADGGYTGAGGKYEVAGMLPDGRPYHRGEYFVAQEEMTHPEVVPLVRRIEQVRRRRTSTNPLPEGFAEGGYSGNNIEKLGIESILSRVADLLDYLKNNPIEAEINYIGFKDAEKRIEQSKENTSL